MTREDKNIALNEHLTKEREEFQLRLETLQNQLSNRGKDLSHAEIEILARQSQLVTEYLVTIEAQAAFALPFGFPTHVLRT